MTVLCITHTSDGMVTLTDISFSDFISLESAKLASCLTLSPDPVDIKLNSKEPCRFYHKNTGNKIAYTVQ